MDSPCAQASTCDVCAAHTVAWPAPPPSPSRAAPPVPSTIAAGRSAPPRAPPCASFRRLSRAPLFAWVWPKSSDARANRLRHPRLGDAVAPVAERRPPPAAPGPPADPRVSLTPWCCCGGALCGMIPRLPWEPSARRMAVGDDGDPGTNLLKLCEMGDAVVMSVCAVFTTRFDCSIIHAETRILT